MAAALVGADWHSRGGHCLASLLLNYSSRTYSLRCTLPSATG